MPASRHKTRSVHVTTGGPLTSQEDRLVHEAPLQITINGTPFSITMRTPGDDHALTAGLLLSEGVVQLLPNTFSLETISENEVNLTIPEVYLCDAIREPRSIASTASCGVCGKAAFTEIEGDALPKLSTPLATSAIPAMYQQLQQQQPTFAATGGAHAAALFSSTHEMLSCHEDIGRHNAVDKCIGELLMQDGLNDTVFLLVSGRVSYEIVVKAYRAAIPILCAISAPTSFAAETAEQLGITLAGFCRDDRATIYTHPENLCAPRS